MRVDPIPRQQASRQRPVNLIKRRCPRLLRNPFAIDPDTLAGINQVRDDDIESGPNPETRRRGGQSWQQVDPLPLVPATLDEAPGAMRITQRVEERIDACQIPFDNFQLVTKGVQKPDALIEIHAASRLAGTSTTCPRKKSSALAI